MFKPRKPYHETAQRRLAFNDRSRKLICGALNWCSMSPTASKLQLTIVKIHFVKERYVAFSFRAYNNRNYAFEVRIDDFMSEPVYTLFEKRREVRGDRPLYFQSFIAFFEKNVFVGNWKYPQKEVKACKRT